jgi:hypothetical protein
METYVLCALNANPLKRALTRSYATHVLQIVRDLLGCNSIHDVANLLSVPCLLT